MIIDTSAVIAALRREPETSDILQAIAHAGAVRISAPTLVELTAVVSGQREVSAHHRLRRQLDEWRVETVAFDGAQAGIAQQAYRDYGRGSGHPAKLNLGDCYSYALATARDEPLLYIGDDFSHTDVQSALTAGQ